MFSLQCLLTIIWLCKWKHHGEGVGEVGDVKILTKGYFMLPCASLFYSVNYEQNWSYRKKFLRNGMSDSNKYYLMFCNLELSVCL